MNMDDEDVHTKPYKYSKVDQERPRSRYIYIVFGVAVFCISSCILLAIFLTAKPKGYCPEGFRCSWHSTPSSEYLKDGRCDLLCTTEPCLRSAQFALSRIDSSKDPCQDFYEFACGTFENESILPQKDSEGIHTYQEMETQMLHNLKGLLDTIIEMPGRKGTSLLLTKAVYDDCMNTDYHKDVLTKTVWKKMFPERDILPPWPMTIKNTSYDLRHFGRMMSSSLFFKTNPFFVILVPEEGSLKNASKWNFDVHEPDLEGIYSIYKDLHTNDESNVYVRYQRLIKKILTEVGMNLTDVQNITNETVEFEKVFLRATNKAKKSSELLYRKKEDLRYKKHIHSCQELDHRFKNIKWCRIFRQLLTDYGITTNTNVGITLPAVTDYFGEIDKVFARFSNRVIMNFIAVKFIISHLKYLPSPLREMYYQDQELFPRKNPFRVLLTRGQQCVDVVLEFLWLPLERAYLKQMFSQEKNSKVRYIVRKIKDTFLHLTDKMPWLKDVFHGKNPKEMIQKIGVNIGLSDYLTHRDITAVDRYFEEYIHLDTSDFGKRKNTLIMDILRLKALIRKAPLYHRKEVGILDSLSPFDISTKIFIKNVIDIPYGILDFPLSLPGRPMYEEYATFGSYIFNYVTNILFADVAVENSSMLRFPKSLKCLEEQFDASKTGKTEFKVDLPEGARMWLQFSEVLATLGSFQAYKAYLKEYGIEKGLPGLPFTNEQLFFITNAQVKCEKFTEKGYANYPPELIIPARYRVNLPLANSKEFFKAFRCPVDSPMNPERKCCILGDGNLSHECK